MSADTGTTMTIASINGVLIIDVGDGTANTLLVNLDPNNTIYLANIPAVNPGANQSDNVPLPPNATVVLDDSLPWYAAVQNGQSANLAVIPGGVSFFQIVTIIAKIIEILAPPGAGNGLYVYDTGVAQLGELVASITSAAGHDTVGNVTRRGITVGKPLTPQVVLDWIDNVLGTPAGVVAMPSGNANESEIAELSTRTNGSGGLQQLLTVLAGAKVLARSDNVDIRLITSTTDAVTAAAGGRLVYTNPSNVGGTMLGWDFSGINAVGLVTATNPATGGSPSSIANPEIKHVITTGFPAGWSGSVTFWTLAEMGNLVFLNVNLTIANGTVVTNGETILPASAFPTPASTYLPFSQPFEVLASGAGAPGTPWQTCFVAQSSGLTFNGANAPFTAGVGGAFIQGRVLYSAAL